jgi:predicted transcriptional regulator
MPDTKLPEAELELLACLQRRGHATARELREDLKAHRPMAHASVLTLLGRLERRGLVTRRKGEVGKAFVYSPTKGPSATVRPLLKRLVTRVFDGNPVSMVASLFETRPPTARELDDLQHLLAELRRKRGE